MTNAIDAETANNSTQYRILRRLSSFQMAYFRSRRMRIWPVVVDAGLRPSFRQGLYSTERQIRAIGKLLSVRWEACLSVYLSVCVLIFVCFGVGWRGVGARQNISYPKIPRIRVECRTWHRFMEILKSAILNPQKFDNTELRTSSHLTYQESQKVMGIRNH